MKQYLELVEYVLKNGIDSDDRTKTGTLSIFGYQCRYNLNEGLPILTTKKINISAVIHELLWFLKGDTNIKYLKDNNVNIWNDWADESGELGPIYSKQWINWESYSECSLNKNLNIICSLIEPISSNKPDLIDYSKSIKESSYLDFNEASLLESSKPDFLENKNNKSIKESILENPSTNLCLDLDLDLLKNTHCKIYNKKTINQIQNVIDEIRKNPSSRRLIVNSWNPSDIEKNKDNSKYLPACHTLFQFYVRSNKLSCQLYQRSGDLFLGIPFNITSYSILTYMIAYCCNLEVGEFIHSLGDVHIYKNHIKQCNIQLARKPYNIPKIKIHTKKDEFGYCNIFDIKYEDIEILDYKHHSFIKADISV